MWRSPVIRDEYGPFAPILALMRRSRVEQLVRVTVPDAEMAFGKLECVVALLHPAEWELTPSSGQRNFVEVFRDWRGGIKPCDIAAEIASRAMRVLA